MIVWYVVLGIVGIHCVSMCFSKPHYVVGDVNLESDKINKLAIVNALLWIMFLFTLLVVFLIKPMSDGIDKFMC